MNMMQMATLEEAARDAWETKGALQASIVKASEKDLAFKHYYLGFLAGARHSGKQGAVPNSKDAELEKAVQQVIWAWKIHGHEELPSEALIAALDSLTAQAGE